MTKIQIRPYAALKNKNEISMFMADNISKITIISGGNQFEMRNAKTAFIEKSEKLYPNGTREFFDGTDEIPFWEFIQKIATPSMFGDTKFLFINHAEDKNVLLLKSNFEAFEKMLHVCADEVFVFVELNENTEEKSAKDCFTIKELSEKLKQTAQNFGGVFTEYKAMKEYEIPKWIIVKIREYYGREINEDNAALLVKYCGADLGILDGELRKIDIALPSGKEITQNDIYELIGNNRQISAQEIIQSIGLRKWDIDTLSMFENYIGKTDGFAVPFLSELFRHFWTLLKIRLFADENRLKVNVYFDKRTNREIKNTVVYEIGAACGILKETQKNAIFPIIIKPQLIEQARNYSKEQFYEIIKTITQYDREIKNGEIKSDSQKEAVKDLCRKIVRTGN